MSEATEQPPIPNVSPLTLSDAKLLAPALLRDNESLRLAVEAIQGQDAIGVLILMSALRDRIKEMRIQGQ